jgi:heme A synthase
VLASAVSLYWGFALAPPEAAAGVPALIVIPTTVALLTGAALCSPRPVQGPRVLAVPLIAAAALVLGLAARTVLLPVLLGHPSVFALAHAMGWLVVLTPLIVAAVLLGRLGLRLARGERSTGSF